MTEPEQIPHLIKLLDDDSSDIRGVVANELSAFGPNLKHELRKIGQPLTTVQRGHLEKIMAGYKRTQLKRMWLSWLKQDFSREDFELNCQWIESALSIFSEYLSSFDSDLKLTKLLDGLAGTYKAKYKNADPIRLAKFLFKEKGLHGDEDNYYSPQNGNLHYVIKEKKGIPISLTAVYLLVGMRLGIRIEGCHFPGHFLARIDLNGEKVFVDCFNSGQVIDEKDLLNIRDGAFKEMKRILNDAVDVNTTVHCYLANLIRAYQVQEDEDNCQLFIDLFRQMDIHGEQKKVADLTPEDIINPVEPFFKPGQCVHHLRYGYRGIVVEIDPDCRATDDWYYGNQTQPKRNQPWYHVLVHGSDQVTYVAENNLVKDTLKEKIKHPLLSFFFKKDKEGKYIRNDNPWPETDI